MSLINSIELEELKVALAELDITGYPALAVIQAVVEVIAPSKLMDSYDLKRVMEHASNPNATLKDMYDFSSKQACIQIQLPELWEQQEKIEQAMSDMQKIAKFLATPVDAENL